MAKTVGLNDILVVMGMKVFYILMWIPLDVDSYVGLYDDFIVLHIVLWLPLVN